MKSPEIGVYWKPSAWPDFMLFKNNYNPEAWWRTKHVHSSCWKEVVRSDIRDTLSLGIWFYTCSGSGVFVDSGKSIMIVPNKIQAALQLFGITEIAMWILRNGTGRGEFNRTNGLGGADSFFYWLPGQNQRTLQTLLDELHLPTSVESVSTLLSKACEQHSSAFIYNRMATTGCMDELIIFEALRLGYDSVLFEAQPNVWTGWCSELILIGAPHTSVSDIPRESIRMLDPDNLPPATKGFPCKLEFGLK
jgi:hypothetical protein